MIRSRISAAAFRVNVTARMLSGSTPARSRLTYRSTRTRVFPVPADASSTTFRDGSTASRRAASSAVHIVFPADCGETARLAPVDVVGCRRKFSAADRVERGGQTLLGLAHHVATLGGRTEQRNDPPRTFEG